MFNVFRRDYRTKGFVPIFSRLLSIVRSLLWWTLAAVVVCAVAVGFYYYQRVDEEVRRHVLKLLSEQYPRHSVSLEAAQLVKGEGIRLRGLSIVQRADSASRSRGDLLLVCEEVVLECDLAPGQLLQGKVDIRRVRLRGLTLRPTREQDGSWNLSELIPAKPTIDPTPIVMIQDAHVELTDRRCNPPSVLNLNALRLTLTPRGRGESVAGTADPGPTAAGMDSLAITANFTTQHCRDAEVRGWVAPHQGSWSLQGSVTDLRWSEDLLRSLPAEVTTRLGELDGLTARLSLAFSASQDAGSSTGPKFAVVGRLMDGRFEAARQLPAAMTEIHVPSLRCDNDGWQISDLHARYETAEISLSAQSDARQTDRELAIWGRVENLNITRELIDVLPDSLRSLWQKYQPLGLVDADFTARRRQAKWWLESKTKCRDVSLTCEKFDYPLVRVHGDVDFRQHEHLNVNLWGSADHVAERTPVHIEAQIVQPGPRFRGVVRVATDDWLPLDKRLVWALPPGTRKILNDLDARGEITFAARLWRDESTGDRFHKDITVEVRDGAVRHAEFPYPLDRVQGRLHVGEQLWTFEDFAGRNDGCFVKCSGQWVPAAQGLAGGELRLGFVATDIPCDEELRQALAAGPRMVWKSLRPTGVVDHAHIDLHHRAGMSKPALDIVVTQLKRESDPERRSLVIQPTWFPLRMSQVSGAVVYKHDGTFQLQNLEAVHGTLHRPVALRARGRGQFHDDGSWQVELRRLMADGVETTPELLAALPPSLGEGLRSVRFLGRLSLDGSMNFSGGPQFASAHSDWAVRVNVDDGSLRVAEHPLDHLFGQVYAEGRLSGDAWSNIGQVHVDSVMYENIQITDVDAPWMMDPRSLVFGSGAAGQATPADARHVRGRLFNGAFEADGFVTLDAEHQFHVESVFADVNLAELARDMNLPSTITGRGFARLDLHGNAQGKHTWGGEGGVRIRDANIAKLPAIITLINELRVRDVSADVFSSSDMEFEIQGPYLNFQRFDLHGESLTLKGQGWMSLDRRINLAFYTILGGENRWLPFARAMVGQASQQFLQILVTGTIDDARWTREVLPGLNETLQQLFPEQASTSDRRGALRRPSNR